MDVQKLYKELYFELYPAREAEMKKKLPSLPKQKQYAAAAGKVVSTPCWPPIRIRTDEYDEACRQSELPSGQVARFKGFVYDFDQIVTDLTHIRLEVEGDEVFNYLHETANVWIGNQPNVGQRGWEELLKTKVEPLKIIRKALIPAPKKSAKETSARKESTPDARHTLPSASLKRHGDARISQPTAKTRIIEKNALELEALRYEIQELEFQLMEKDEEFDTLRRSKDEKIRLKDEKIRSLLRRVNYLERKCLDANIDLSDG